MSVFLMKTRDLTWQDRALNMEVMLEPKRTNLLFKKNKSLSMNYEKDRVRYSKQMNAKLRMFKTEKHYIDQKNQEFYLVKTKRFLGSLNPEQRQQLLSRKSFSIGLSKLAKDIEEEEEYNERYSAPSTFSTRRVSVFGSFVSSTQNLESPDDRQDLVTTTIESPEPEVKLPNLPVKAPSLRLFKSGRKHASPVADFRRFRSAEDMAVVDLDSISNPHTPIPSYLPSASPIDRSQRSLIDYGSVETKKRNIQNQTSTGDELTTKKAVQFEAKEEKKQETPRNSYEVEKGKVEREKPMIQRKINSFLRRQSNFNKQAPVCKHKKVTAIVNPDDSYNIDKGKLVHAFDEFCVKGGRDKLQRLVKYATKYKVTSTFKQSNVITPSVEKFKTSRTFMNIANTSHVQPISARA